MGTLELVGVAVGVLGLLALAVAALYAWHFQRWHRLLSGVDQTGVSEITGAGPVWLAGTITDPDGTAGRTLAGRADRPVVTVWSVARYESVALTPLTVVMEGVDATGFTLDCADSTIDVALPSSRPGLVPVGALLGLGLQGVVTREAVAVLDYLPGTGSDFVGVSAPSGGYLTGKPRLRDRMDRDEGASLELYLERYEFAERVFEPGDRIRVLGHVHTEYGVDDPTGVGDLVVGEFPGRDPVVVTTEDRAALLSVARRRRLVGVGAALLAAVPVLLGVALVVL
jgi:hypothetical protein